MQYYENPVNIDKQELIEDLEDLMVEFRWSMKSGIASR